MAMTQTGLMILGAIATLASAGILRGSDDAGTEIVMHMAATVTWLFFGFGSLDVIVRDNYAATASEPMYPLAWTGLAFGLISGALTLWRIVKAVGEETPQATTEGGFFDGSR